MSLFDLSVCLVIFFSLIIYVWKDTSLIPDILSFVTAGQIGVIKRWKRNLNNIDFPLFLETENQNLITSLLACPFCLSFWSSILLFCLNIIPDFLYIPLYWYGIYISYLLIKKLEL
jgi:hypothetical protein